jgi:hypothetical protein
MLGLFRKSEKMLPNSVDFSCSGTIEMVPRKLPDHEGQR